MLGDEPPVLTVNAGSSSVKLVLVGGDGHVSAELVIQAPDGALDLDELRQALDGGLSDAEVVAHRIVHGGERFRDAILIDDEVIVALRELTDLAPLHQPRSLAALDAVSSLLPELPTVACFDTAFHATLPPAAATFALPARWRERWGLRRYGFHGLSHSWVARRAPELLGPAAERGDRGLRIVSCHLGAGASLCAIVDGASVDTTMGFTPLDGLVMATRSGSVDPGMLLWLLEREALTELELARALEHQSGLLGLAGDADMAAVLERSDAGDPPAVLAIDVYMHRLVAAVCAMAGSLGGIDVLVFTGGVGEHAPAVRARAAKSLGFLGVSIDEAANDAVSPDADISAPGAPVRTLVLRAREDLELAREARLALADP